jgi:hypothetical protein
MVKPPRKAAGPVAILASHWGQAYQSIRFQRAPVRLLPSAAPTWPRDSGPKLTVPADLAHRMLGEGRIAKTAARFELAYLVTLFNEAKRDTLPPNPDPTISQS